MSRRGTEGSNPSPSSDESANHRSARELAIAACVNRPYDPENAHAGHSQSGGRMLSRRDFVSVAAATAGAPRLASAQPASTAPKEPVTGFYEKGGVRIRYQEVGSGFPLL